MRHLSKFLFCLLLLLWHPFTPWVEPANISCLALQARALGMGQSTLALLDDYPASGNPAALGRAFNQNLLELNGNTSLAQAAGIGLSLSQARLSYDQYGYQINLTTPLALGQIGFNFDQLIIQNQAYYRLLFNPDGTPIIDPVTNQQAWELKFDTRVESLFSFAYGLPLAAGWQLGLEPQVLHINIGENYAWGFDGDVGLGYQVLPTLSLAAQVKNVNGAWRAWRKPYQEEVDRPTLALGGAGQLASLNLLVCASLEQKMHWQEKLQGHLGIEYQLFAPLDLRLGWDADHVNVGVGLVWAMVHLDYAAILGGALYDANRITVEIVF